MRQFCRSGCGRKQHIPLTADGENFNSGKNMASLANSAGNLGKLCLIGRLDSGKDRSYYLDSITICYKDGATDDTVPPRDKL